MRKNLSSSPARPISCWRHTDNFPVDQFGLTLHLIQVLDRRFQSAGPLGFFTATELPRPALFMYVAFVVEVIAGVALVLGMWTQVAAWVAAAFLFAATLATLKVSKGNWFWMVGGCEYPLFWALCCVIVAMHA